MQNENSHAQPQSLGFSVRFADAVDLEKAVKVRSAAYGRSLPDAHELVAKLALPEAADFEPGCAVVVACSDADQSVMGTMRIHTNAHKPLPLEASVVLPERFSGRRLSEVTRLSVLRSPQATLVRNALFKAFYLFSIEQKIDFMIVAGRKPVDRMHDMLLFTDVFEKGVYIPMAHAGNIPHRVLCFDIEAAPRTWASVNHPMLGFVVDTNHPGINMSAPCFYEERESIA
jgi:hypothetical protein